MKIVYIHQYFKTLSEAGAIRSYHLAKRLVQEGYDVEMITSHNRKSYRRVELEGIIVHYLPVAYRNEFGFAARIYAFLKFITFAYRLIRSIGGISLVYATSTPLMVGLLAMVLKKRKGISYVFEARDLWPDAPIQMGVVSWPLAIKYLYRLERNIYSHASAIIALSPPAQRIIESRAPGKTVHLLPNFADPEFFKPEEADEKLKKALGITEEFVMIYFGAIGKANWLDPLLDLADLCRRRGEKIRFLIVGAGSEKINLQDKARKLQLDNTTFIDPQNKFALKRYLDLAHASYISFDTPIILETCCPNKLFDSLAAGKLIIYNKGGWIRDLIETYQCGFYADSGSPEKALEALRPIIADNRLLDALQQNALKAAKHYSKERVLEEFIQIIGEYSRNKGETVFVEKAGDATNARI